MTQDAQQWAAEEAAGIARRVVELLDRHGPSRALDGAHARWAVAEGVAQYVVREDAGAAVDEGRLLLLTARALRSVGGTDLARRMVVCGTGLVRSGRLEVAGAGNAWLVSLAVLRVPGDGDTELAAHAAMRQLVTAVAELWACSHGEGVLGLAGLDAFARRILGRDPAPGAVARLSRELLQRCGDELERAARARDWAHVPRVVITDFGRRANGQRRRGSGR